MSLNTRELVHEGEKKILYSGSNHDRLTMAFKDITPGLPNSGIFWNLMNEQIFKLLNSCAIPNHYVKTLNLREQEVHNTSLFPFYVRITNVVTEPIHAVFDMEMGTKLSKPLLEFMVKKNGKKHVIEQAYLSAFDWCKAEHLEEIKKIAYRTNDVLQSYFYQYSTQISHCYLRFGIFDPQYTYTDSNKEEIILVNDLTLNNFTLWCMNNQIMLPITTELIQGLGKYMKINLHHCAPVEPTLSPNPTF